MSRASGARARTITRRETPRRRIVVAFALLATAVGCAGRGTVPAPTDGHRPEPVAPIMMPAAQVAAPPDGRATVTYLADSAIGAPQWRNARWGVLILHATSGDTLYAHDAERLFMPASNQKLLTAAVALTVLGPEYRWRTPILLRGTLRGSVLRGDLLVVGTGDPSVSDSLRNGDALSAFDPIVAALAARGITRITGDVLTEGDAFTGITTGYGWEVDDLDSPYGAPTDELLFNEGLLRVTVSAGTTVGAKVHIARAPTTTYPALLNEARTRAPSDTGPRIRLVYDSSAAALRVTGTLAIGDSVRLSASYRHPNDAYRVALRERLMARGVKIDGAAAKATPASRRAIAARGTGAVSQPIDTLVVLESPTLREVLPRMQKPSQNQIAELLFRTAGRAVSGDGGADSARAVATRTLIALGVDSSQVAYRDGSGMSRHDYVSPRSIVQVLRAMHQAPWAASYREALPLAGVDGTIANRMRNGAAAGNAYAKTGTVDKARSLSGYVTSADGQPLIFSILANNFTASNREVERVQDLIVSTLAALPVGSVGAHAR